MLKSLLVGFLLLTPLLAGARCPDKEITNEGELSCVEKAELEERLNKFYGDPNNGDSMSIKIPKFGVHRGTWIEPKAYMKLKKPVTDKLLEQAQLKATDEYQNYICKNFLNKYFPKMRCGEPQKGGKATVEDDDRVEDLVKTWIPERNIAWSLDEIPAQGKTSLPLWGDDYWALKFGGTSYRYAEEIEYKTYKTAIAAYDQPAQWSDLLAGGFKINELAEKIIKWSPAEKYDLSVGDDQFNLTNSEKMAGWDMRNAKGDVEDWMGICDGWSAASIMVPAPMTPVTLTGTEGVAVHWYPHDVRAMATLAWAHGTPDTNNVGGRCDSKKPKVYSNGRLVQQECFDTNPTTFHLALGNMIGKGGFSFVMDKSFDYEVWNQPIHSYTFTYFNPLKPKVRNKDWNKVAVDYDETFIAKDRFQHPLTRGMRKGRRYSDKGIKKIVGVIATVTYLEEIDPIAGAKPEEDSLIRQTYTYDLELHKDGADLVPEGGEWHNNVHPDFLWVPQKGTSAGTSYDKASLRFTGNKIPSSNVTEVAARASRKAGYPLCQVVKRLVDESSGTKSYTCDVER